MLAEDYVEEKLRFPLIAQPKIDGVRGLNMDGSLTGRSLKQHKNLYTTQFFSGVPFIGFDGEMAAQSQTHPSLCRMTASALGTIKGTPFIQWHLFDYIVPATIRLPYHDRYQALCNRLVDVIAQWPMLKGHLKLVPYIMVQNLDQLNALDAEWLSQGYEGTILRDPDGLHKQGRSTVREAGLLRIKRFADAEARVIRYEEGQANGNEAQTNELGKTFRTSHQENMTPNGQVGTIIAEDVVTGQEFSCSPGNMDHSERASEWLNFLAEPQSVKGRIFTYKHFPAGRKTLPRFPTFKSWRDLADMG
jgi:DNA ligase 1